MDLALDLTRLQYGTRIDVINSLSHLDLDSTNLCNSYASSSAQAIYR